MDNVKTDAYYINRIKKDLHHAHVIKMVGPSYRTKDYYELLDGDEQKTGR